MWEFHCENLQNIYCFPKQSMIFYKRLRMNRCKGLKQGEMLPDLLQCDSGKKIFKREIKRKNTKEGKTIWQRLNNG